MQHWGVLVQDSTEGRGEGMMISARWSLLQELERDAVKGAPHMHPLQFCGPLSILLAPVKDRLFTWIPDVIWLLLGFRCVSFPHCSAAWRQWRDG